MTTHSVEGTRASVAMEEQLLARPSTSAIRNYYDKLAAQGLGLGLRVDHIGGDLGKGVFADRDFEGDDLVMREPMLVGAQHALNKADALVCSCCFKYVGSIELQIGRRLLVAEDSSRQEETATGISEESFMDEDLEEQGEGGNCDCAGSSEEKKPIPPELLKSLLDGDLRLPESDLFPLPPVIECPGGCSDDVFCSDSCAGQAWNSYHSLLCTGPGSLCRDRNSLMKFKEFTDETNDIFHIAAQVIASTMLQARRIKEERRRQGNDCGKGRSDNEILLEAWEPFAMGHKKLWWEAITSPGDIHPSDFINQIKGIASQSLTYLKEALFEEQFAPLFSLNVYGHIIGMFEQNNLDIVVRSPVEDYFVYIDDLPPLAKAEAEAIARSFLDALGSEYAAFCSGSGFFAIQSCMNHSCQPNATALKRDELSEDKDGQVVLLATRCISKGEEITITYIDVEDDVEERQNQLADYGFVCSCPRCREEMSQERNQ